MASPSVQRDFFLWCIAAIYLFAFSSIFVQIPGLYGDNGILPVKLVVGNVAESWADVLSDRLSLLRVLPLLGLSIEASLDFLALGGVIVALVAMVAAPQRNTVTFAVLWVFYLSIYQVGQTFLWFQWDILLLEVGFLCILVAPLNRLGWAGRVSYHQHDSITLWLVKWLLFRLMFASGVVKLTSQCPTWWGLTALNYHYETQCIPTPLAWFAHQLPEWLDKLSVAAAYIIEMALPFLFFSPVRKQRLLAAYAQIFLMAVIQLTGNYNFFNLLTAALCVALLDDTHLLGCLGKRGKDAGEPWERVPILGRLWRPVKWALNVLVFGGLLYWSVKLFGLQLRHSPLRIDSKIGFTNADLERFLKTIMPVTIWMGALSLAWEVVKAIGRSVCEERGLLRKTLAVLGCVLFGAAAVGMFAISLMDHTVLEWDLHERMPPALKQWHRQAERFQLTSSYGLFRRMTGVEGRPEVIVEGSAFSPEGPWLEYNFRYKPGNVSHTPPIVAPHQPRLDWQMWFAALGSYQHNPWFLNLVYRLFHNQKEVLELMGDNPFPDKPPRYIRAKLYHYHFTTINTSAPGSSSADWWRRQHVGEYLPAITVEDQGFTNYIQRAGLASNDTSMKNAPKVGGFLQKVMTSVRGFLGQPDGFLTALSLFITALVLSFLDPTLKFVLNS